MSKFFVKSNQINNNEIKILGTDVNHIKNVLRLSIGNEINICNEETSVNYTAKIDKLEKDYIICKIEKVVNLSVETNVDITIFQGLPKADKMELIIQKSVELGAYDIIPTKMNRCVVKLKEKDANKKIQRWQKISEVAAKQCGRSHIPTIQNITNIEKICQESKNYDIVIVAYEKEDKNTIKEELKKLKKLQEQLQENNLIGNQEISNKTIEKKKEIKIAIVIGPEGGIEEEEINKLEKCGAKIVTLGKRILRTETVALHILSIIMYELES